MSYTPKGEGMGMGRLTAKVFTKVCSSWYPVQQTYRKLLSQAVAWCFTGAGMCHATGITQSLWFGTPGWGKDHTHLHSTMLPFRDRQVPQEQHLCAAGQGAVTDLMSDARFCLISLES